MNWQERFRAHFTNAVSDKGIVAAHADSRIPRFIAESMLCQYCNDFRDAEGLAKYRSALERYVPQPGTRDLWHRRLQTDGEIKLISKFQVEVNVEKHGRGHVLSVPSIGINRGSVEEEILERNPRLLTTGLWGLGRLQLSGDEGAVRLVKFNPFLVASVDLDHYSKGRQRFTEAEWVDILTSTQGFSPSTSDDLSREKLVRLARLIPLVQGSTFLYEFGNPGTGKTYLYDQVASNAFVISGAQASPATLFYNLREQRPGLLAQWDCIVFDEVDKVSDRQLLEEVVNKLLKFMESGSFDRGAVEIPSNASLVFSGNLPRHWTRSQPIFSALARKLQHPAFLDRLSGIVPGWELPVLGRVGESASQVLGFSADYFSQVLTQIRYKDFSWATRRSGLAPGATTRDEKAIARLFEGYVKLVFPHGEASNAELQRYLDLAIEMRQNVIRESFSLHGDPANFRQVTGSLH